MGDTNDQHWHRLTISEMLRYLLAHMPEDGFRCGFCGNRHFTTVSEGEHAALFHAPRLRGPEVSASASPDYVMAMMLCDRCQHTHFFPARLMGDWITENPA